MSSNQPLVDRTDALLRELRSMRRRFRFSAWVTLLVGGLLLLLVAFYFSYGYSEISSFRDPDLIVSLVGNTIDQQIPMVRQRLENEVEANASTWAEQASQQALAAIPPLREQLERLALQQSDRAIAQIDVIGEKQFRRILEENRETVQDAIDQLKNDEEISEEVLQGLQLAIEKELQIDAETQADAVLTFVADLNKNMEKLHANENLNREQRAERRVLMLARRLQGDLEFEELKLPETVKTYLEESEAKRLRKEAIETSAKPGPAPGDTVETSSVEDPTPPKPDKESDDAAEAKPADESEKTEAADDDEKKAAPAEDDSSAKPEAKEKPAAKPEKAAAEESNSGEKPEAEAGEAAEEKPANKPDEKAEADDTSEDGESAEEAEEAPAKESKPAEKPEEEKEAS